MKTSITILSLIVFLYFYPQFLGKIKYRIKSSKSPQLILETTKSVSSNSKFRDERWDLHIVRQDAEKQDIIESLEQLGKKITKKDTPLAWVIQESPETLTAFVRYCLFKPEEVHNDSSYAFYKFMHEPGTEIVLTEAAYRGYLPAMSILASHYENTDNSVAADYWLKVGVAHLNPTSIMLRGLNLVIQGQQNNKDSLVEQGRNLIVLSYMLGEDTASEIEGFEKLSRKKPIDCYNNEDLLKTIYEIENINEKDILPFLTEIRGLISEDRVKISNYIDVITKINGVLDNHDVTIAEIAVLFPLRKTITDMLNVEMADNLEFLEAFGKAELVWKYQRVGAGSNFVNETIIPMIYKNN